MLIDADSPCQHLRRLQAVGRHHRPLPPQRRRPTSTSACAGSAAEGDCKLVIVEGIYSMLGDTAPLREFVEVKKRHGAWLLVDEAHSFGCFGAHGRGLAEAAGRRGRRRLRRRHVQQEPGRDRRLRRLQPPAVRSAAPVRAALHVHRLAEPGQHRLGACGPAPDRVRPVPARPPLGQCAPAARRLHGLGLRPCSPPSPVIAVPMADEVDGSAGLEPAARARRLREPRPAAGHAQQPLPAALQRLGGSQLRADRRDRGAVRRGDGWARSARAGVGGHRLVS